MHENVNLKKVVPSLSQDSEWPPKIGIINKQHSDISTFSVFSYNNISHNNSMHNENRKSRNKAYFNKKFLGNDKQSI